MESDIANGDCDDYIREMDRRLTILETRFDTILPTLATKADLADLKMELLVEMHKLSSGMHKWLAAMSVALLIGFGGMSLTMLSIIGALSDRVEQATAQRAR